MLIFWIQTASFNIKNVVSDNFQYKTAITIQKYIFTNNVMSQGSTLIIPVIPIYLL